MNRAANETTQIGWWVPARDESDPPEKWLMNLADVYLRNPVGTSIIAMRQRIWLKGLYDDPKASLDGYKINE